MTPSEDDSSLLRYFIKKSDERFNAVEKKIDDTIAPIHQKLDDLTKFKIEMGVNARWIALLISSACGLFSLIASISISLYLAKAEPGKSGSAQRSQGISHE